jgi:hypothetical protein
MSFAEMSPEEAKHKTEQTYLESWKEGNMNQAYSFLAGAGVGAGLMYILHPQEGRRRRALTRDKVVGLARQAQDAAEVVAKDMRNRAQGLASEFAPAMRG